MVANFRSLHYRLPEEEMGLEELGEAAVKKFKNPRLNVVPQVLGAVRAYATIGEIHGIFRKTFGVFRGNQ